MAIKYVCDRCNEEIRNIDVFYYHLIVFKTRKASGLEMDLDLCEACYNALDLFIRTGSKQSPSYSIPSEKTTTIG